MKTPKTKTFPNFYENQKEATIRLQDTVILYDDVPHYVYGISDFKKDGILRVFMEPIGHPQGLACNRSPGMVWSLPDPDLGIHLTDWMEKNPNSGVVRKYMTSHHFNKFRPFPLGMCNFQGSVCYIQRQPLRHTQQGLTQQHLLHHWVDFSNSGHNHGLRRPDFTSPEMRDTIMGDYPSFHTCIEAMADPSVTNSAVAFHRDFALVRGPFSTLYLAYKTDVIGSLPMRNHEAVYIGNEFAYAKEVTEELNLFNNVNVQGI